MSVKMAQWVITQCTDFARKQQPGAFYIQLAPTPVMQKYYTKEKAVFLCSAFSHLH